MKTLHQSTADLICKELENLPVKYQDKNFNSTHEGYAVILEEVRELEQEVFFGEKPLREKWKGHSKEKEIIKHEYQKRLREECIQIAAMCVRFIQELAPETPAP